MRYKTFFVFLMIAWMAGCARNPNPIPSNPMQTEVIRQLTAVALGKTAGVATSNVPTNDGGGSAPTTALPSVTPTGTPTQTPTPTLSPTFTPPLEDPRLSLGNPTWKTDFADAYGWYLYDDDTATFEITDHKFVMIGKKPNYYRWTLTPSTWILTNYYLEMTATTDTCSGRDSYGFTVGVPYPANNPSYLFRFSCDGFYSFGYFDNTVDNKFHYLKDWTKTSYLLAGSNQTNRMGFKALDHKVFLYANGYFLAEINEPAFGEGRFGIFIGAVNTVNFTVRLSEVAYWILT